MKDLVHATSVAVRADRNSALYRSRVQNLNSLKQHHPSAINTPQGRVNLTATAVGARGVSIPGAAG